MNDHSHSEINICVENALSPITKRNELNTSLLPYSQILQELVRIIVPIDFRQLADIPDKEKVKHHHYLVIVIEQILHLAKVNNWGLCRNYDFIYLFNGEYWQLIDEEDLKAFLCLVAQKMGMDTYIAKVFHFRDHLFKQFIASAHLPKPEFSKDSVFINLQNGTFEITPTHTKLRSFNHHDFMTYQLGFKHDLDAKMPLFEAYLNKVLPDKNSQKVLAEYLGYVFIRPAHLKLEKTLLLYGSGANGKSVFYEIVRKLLGEQNTSEFSLQNLTNENGYSRAMIANKLVNYASEINGRLQASIFKQLVSGEPVEARLPYGKPFILTEYAKMIFNCNELPKDVEHTDAYFRRFLIIPFTVTIPEHEQDKQLAQKIIASELSGIFNWVLDGLNRLLEQKQFTECEAAQFAREQYVRESDSVKQFLFDRNYVSSATQIIAVQKLYNEYREFCTDDGFKAVNKTNFKKRLESCRVAIERRNYGYIAYLIREY
jgi:putative DNA primase/helicase